MDYDLYIHPNATGGSSRPKFWAKSLVSDLVVYGSLVDGGCVSGASSSTASEKLRKGYVFVGQFPATLLVAIGNREAAALRQPAIASEVAALVGMLDATFGPGSIPNFSKIAHAARIAGLCPQASGDAAARVARVAPEATPVLVIAEDSSTSSEEPFSYAW